MASITQTGSWSISGTDGPEGLAALEVDAAASLKSIEGDFNGEKAFDSRACRDRSRWGSSPGRPPSVMKAEQVIAHCPIYPLEIAHRKVKRKSYRA
jgi:hypothetical protein